MMRNVVKTAGRAELSMRVRVKNWHPLRLAFSLALCALIFSGCGKESFEKPEFASTFTANQFVTIKPKVDIVIFQDISASMLGSANIFRAQMAQFLSQVNSDWDMNLVVLPLQTDQGGTDLSQRYIVSTDCGNINSIYCISPGQAQGIISPNGASDDGLFFAANGSIGNKDDGFVNMQSQLQNPQMRNLGVLRDDAMIAVIPFTNGADTSGMIFPTDYKDIGGGQMIPDYTTSNATASFATFFNFLTTQLKATPSLMNFFSVAGMGGGQYRIANCNGSAAFTGERYHDMASVINTTNPAAVNGKGYNICGSGLANVMPDIAIQLRDIILTVEFNYVSIPVKPDPSTIRILKNGVEIPANDNINGWTLYLGGNGTHDFETNFPTSFSPAPGNERDGFMIELHGTARFSGADQIEVIYEELL